VVVVVTLNLLSLCVFCCQRCSYRAVVVVVIVDLIAVLFVFVIACTDGFVYHFFFPLPFSLFI